MRTAYYILACLMAGCVEHPPGAEDAKQQTQSGSQLKMEAASKDSFLGMSMKDIAIQFDEPVTMNTAAAVSVCEDDGPSHEVVIGLEGVPEECLILWEYLDTSDPSQHICLYFNGDREVVLVKVKKLK